MKWIYTSNFNDNGISWSGKNGKINKNYTPWSIGERSTNKESVNKVGLFTKTGTIPTH
jgi:hypothetical protein